MQPIAIILGTLTWIVRGCEATGLSGGTTLQSAEANVDGICNHSLVEQAETASVETVARLHIPNTVLIAVDSCCSKVCLSFELKL